MLFYATCKHFYRPLKSCDIRFGMDEVGNNYIVGLEGPYLDFDKVSKL